MKKNLKRGKGKQIGGWGEKGDLFVANGHFIFIFLKGF